ncbi:MAG: peroxiredoxin family protein [Desulfuromonadales bacterium]|uniref:peroxiredoxin family protein n=1 Tax=Desulfuromonas sp. KJ2020 TaxID=2919173 RepID=UPI000323DC5D|nr:redoxin domain-containing protein [Desulfuromonas sp. KJ2020]MCP3175615.1 redoxin domain-containing protein [Desulfuromonas sp. KJ2020]MDW7644430.1 redoxin domain-containing protein [Desulfuromonadales bacterium]MDW7756662.1 redoxin domain-containing protein [Desulfuromonadales bacterium]
MEGHQRNLYLYDRFNARVAGVSRDNVDTLKYFAEEYGLTFPLFSNTSSYLGTWLGAYAPGSPVFARRTVVIDKWGTIRYSKSGNPNYHEVLQVLKELHAEEVSP